MPPRDFCCCVGVVAAGGVALGGVAVGGVADFWGAGLAPWGRFKSHTPPKIYCKSLNFSVPKFEGFMHNYY